MVKLLPTSPGPNGFAALVTSLLSVPSIVRSRVISGKAVVKLTVRTTPPAMLKLMTFVVKLAFESIIACRKLPAPELATVLTVKVAAFVAVAVRQKMHNKKKNGAK